MPTIAAPLIFPGVVANGWGWISDATRDWLKLYSPPRRESLCPENVSFLKKVLETCTSDCHPPANTPYLPTRLLDLGTDPASHPRLIITADSLGSEAQNPAEPIRYAALSYCWGSRADATAQTKTEPSNLHERLRAIPTHDMSAVMQDAVKVCRALSVRYLWIDALCIIQDPADPSDWERESERVGKVYQHAYFTICAVSTPSCHYSFLARSQHTFDLDFQSSLYPPARGTYTLVCCTGLAWGEEGYDPLSIDFRHSAWYERGWVFQEDNLSARKLLFGQHMVHFVCGRMEVSENDENCWSAIDDWSAAAVAKLGREELFRQFSNTAGSYGGRMLSYESDRLPALSGLARHVYDATGAKYLAGLWKEDLHRGLLWYGQNDISHSLVQHLDAIRASAGSGPPSWSWVSQPGYFDHGLHSSRDSSDRHSVRPEYGSINGWTVLSGAQLNPFGQVKSGTIRIQGKVSSVPADFVLLSRRVFPRVDIWKVYHDRVVVAYCHLDWDVGSPKQEPGRLEMLLLASSCSAQDVLDFHGGDGDKPESEEEDEEGDGDVSEDGDEHEHEGDPNPASPLEAEINNSARIPADGGILPGSARPLLDPGGLHDNEKSNRNAWGLIIHPAQKPGEYYRVGVFVSPAGKASGTRFFKAAKERSIDII